MSRRELASVHHSLRRDFKPLVYVDLAPSESLGRHVASRTSSIALCRLHLLSQDLSEESLLFVQMFWVARSYGLVGGRIYDPREVGRRRGQGERQTTPRAS